MTTQNINQTLSDIYSLEKQLNELPYKVKVKVTLYSKNIEEVIDASKTLNSHLFHPHPDGKNYYWFDYKSKDKKNSIRVKSPYL